MMVSTVCLRLKGPGFASQSGNALESKYISSKRKLYWWFHHTWCIALGSLVLCKKLKQSTKEETHALTFKLAHILLMRLPRLGTFNLIHYGVNSIILYKLWYCSIYVKLLWSLYWKIFLVNYSYLKFNRIFSHVLWNSQVTKNSMLLIRVGFYLRWSFGAFLFLQELACCVKIPHKAVTWDENCWWDFWHTMWQLFVDLAFWGIYSLQKIGAPIYHPSIFDTFFRIHVKIKLYV